LKDGLMGKGEICESDIELGGICIEGLGPENMLYPSYPGRRPRSGNREKAVAPPEKK
jgi:hypothetical protein